MGTFYTEIVLQTFFFSHRVPCTHRRALECTKHFPAPLCTTSLAQRTYQYILLCTTKLAHSTSQYYFVLQSWHKARPSTTLIYFVLQNLHRALPCTTLYYKVCTKRFPVRLCTTKLAQRSSQYFVLRRLRNVLPMQYYFVLQSLHAVLRTTLYDKTCAKYFPVILGSARHAQSHKVLPSTTSY